MTVLVTGGSRGIGQAICKRLAPGANIAVVSKDTQENFSATERIIEEAGGRSSCGSIWRHRCFG